MTQPTFHCPSCEVGWRPTASGSGSDWPRCWSCGAEGKPGAPQLSSVPPGMGNSYTTPPYALPIGA